jgi:Thiol-disulfide isomerase and thioredoxins
MKYVLAFVALCLVCSAANAQSKLPIHLKVTTPDGATAQLGDIIKGDLPVVITFWATWCKPCLNELESLKDIQDEWQGKVRIIAIAMDDSKTSAKVKALVSGKRLPFEIYQDINQEFFQAMNFSSIPFAVVVNSEGTITYQHSGFSPGSETALIDAALKMQKK